MLRFAEWIALLAINVVAVKLSVFPGVPMMALGLVFFGSRWDVETLLWIPVSITVIVFPPLTWTMVVVAVRRFLLGQYRNAWEATCVPWLAIGLLRVTVYRFDDNLLGL